MQIVIAELVIFIVVAGMLQFFTKLTELLLRAGPSNEFPVLELGANRRRWHARTEPGGGARVAAAVREEASEVVGSNKCEVAMKEGRRRSSFGVEGGCCGDQVEDEDERERERTAIPPSTLTNDNRSNCNCGIDDKNFSNKIGGTDCSDSTTGNETRYRYYRSCSRGYDEERNHFSYYHYHHRHPCQRNHRNHRYHRRHRWKNLIEDEVLRTCCDDVRSRTKRSAVTRCCRIPPYIATLLILSYTLLGIADACSSRSTPKPRPPTPTPRLNITFHTYTCPLEYAEWYCLNGATCFTVKIVDSLLYNCLCAKGYIGQRCEFKDLDGSYLPSRQRVMLETASIAGGATIAVFLVVIICIAAYIHCKRKQKEMRTSDNCVDTVDGPGGRDPELRPFSNRSRSSMVFVQKNSNRTPANSSIEQTKLPGWTRNPDESTRMSSITENKSSSL